MTPAYWRTLLAAAQNLYDRDPSPDREAAWRRAKAMARVIAERIHNAQLAG
jgi:hypothetical protein